MMGNALGSILISLISPDADPSLTALTTTAPPSLTSSYMVSFGIFLKVSGFHPSGKAAPDGLEENFPTSSTVEESGIETEGAKRSPAVRSKSLHVMTIYMPYPRRIQANSFISLLFVP